MRGVFPQILEKVRRGLDKGVFGVVYLSCNSQRAVDGVKIINSEELLCSNRLRIVFTDYQQIFNRFIDSLNILGLLSQKLQSHRHKTPDSKTAAAFCASTPDPRHRSF